MLAEAAHNFFPRLSLDLSTLRSAGRVLSDDSLDLSLRRALVDETDELRRGLRVRDTFPS